MSLVKLFRYSLLIFGKDEVEYFWIAYISRSIECAVISWYNIINIPLLVQQLTLFGMRTSDARGPSFFGSGEAWSEID